MASKMHSALIRAWLDGAQIQSNINNGTGWHDIDEPNWYEGTEYRIKPTPLAKQYPVTAMTAADLTAVFSQIVTGNLHGLPCADGNWMKSAANAVLRHAIDNGQVAPLEAYSQCAADLLKAEETIAELNRELIKSKMHAMNHGYGY